MSNNTEENIFGLTKWVFGLWILIGISTVDFMTAKQHSDKYFKLLIISYQFSKNVNNFLLSLILIN